MKQNWMTSMVLTGQRASDGGDFTYRCVWFFFHVTFSLFIPSFIHSYILSFNHSFIHSFIRCRLTENGKVLAVTGPLWLPSWTQGRFLLPLVTADLKFILAKNSFCLRSNSTAHQYRVHIDKFLVKLSRVHVNAAVAAKIETRLSKSPALYPIRTTKARIFTIPQGTKHYETEVFGAGATVVPNLCYLMLTTTRASQGEYGLCPFRFQHFNLTSLCMSIDGTSRPSPNGYTNIIWEGKNANYMQMYYDLFDANIKVNEGCSINLSEYPQNFCIFKLDLGYFLTQSHDHIENKKLSNCRLSLTFSGASNNESLSLIVYSESNSTFYINSQREVTRDYML